MKKSYIYPIFLGLCAQSSIAQECPGPLSETAIEMERIIESAPQKYKSVEEFLAALPKKMTSNFIFMGESRSFQTASPESPRVILMSPRSEVRISFNTEEGQRGFNNIEISRWDPKKSEFIYEELSFDPEGQSAPKHHGDIACTTCHGNPPKPNWDTYNYWAGVIPFNKDTLVDDTVEKELYMRLLKKTNDKSPSNRLGYLTPIENEEKIKKDLEEDGYMQRQFLSEDGEPTFAAAGGIATELFDNLQDFQECAESKRLQKSQNYEDFKYLLAGIRNYCDLDEFVPDWFHAVANDYFYGTLEDFKLESSADDLFKTNFTKITDDTRARQMRVRKDKDNRQRFFIEKVSGSRDVADKEMKTQIEKIGLNVIGVSPGRFDEDIGESTEELAKFRYFLEPFGAGVSRFSTSIDPTTYSFADTFNGDYLSYEERERMKEEMSAKGLDSGSCADLAKESRQRLSNKDLMGRLIANASMVCSEKIDAKKQISPLKKGDADSFSGLVDIQARNIFNNKCASCHKQDTFNGLDYSVGGAPVIPFGELDKLKEFLRSPKGKLLGYAGIIKDRINRPHDTPGLMPLQDIGQLEAEDKQFLNAWIEEFMSKEGGEK